MSLQEYLPVKKIKRKGKERMSRMSLPPAWDNSLVLFPLITTVSCCTFIFVWGGWRGFCFNELITWQITEAFPVPGGSIWSFYFCNSEIKLWAMGKQSEKCPTDIFPCEVLYSQWHLLSTASSLFQSRWKQRFADNNRRESSDFCLYACEWAAEVPFTP